MQCSSCRRRSAPEADELILSDDDDTLSHDSDEDEQIAERWLHLTRRLGRLAFKRREWAFLGHWLRQVKQRGR